MNKPILSSVSVKHTWKDIGLLGSVALQCCYDFREPLAEAGVTLNASSGTIKKDYCKHSQHHCRSRQSANVS